MNYCIYTHIIDLSNSETAILKEFTNIESAPTSRFKLVVEPEFFFWGAVLNLSILYILNYSISKRIDMKKKKKTHKIFIIKIKFILKEITLNYDILL